MKKEIVQYKLNGKKKYIRSGKHIWSTICPSHLPMMLQKLGYKIDEIRGFDIKLNNNYGKN